MDADRDGAAPVDVSVVMPVFNAARFLGASIESVLAQTLERFEFLIYDDGSTDGSADLAAGYARRDSRIRFFAMPHRGYVTWLNEGLQAARGEFVARMDADDVCVPVRLERQRDFLRAHPTTVAVGSDYLSIDEDGEPLLVDRHATEHERLLELFLAGRLGVIAHPTCMMRRAAVLRVGGYRKRYETTEDLDLWPRLAAIGRLANIPEVLLHYRHHEASVCYAQTHRQRPLLDEIVNQARASLGQPPLGRSVWPRKIGIDDPYWRRVLWARWAVLAGNPRAGLKHARIAIRLAPWRLSGWVVGGACVLPRWMVAAAVRLRRAIRRLTGAQPRAT